jgi:hypothetical protein
LIVCMQQLFQVLKFQNTHSQIFQHFYQSSFRLPNRVWNSTSSSLARNTLWILYFCFSRFSSERR